MLGLEKALKMYILWILVLLRPVQSAIISYYCILGCGTGNYTVALSPYVGRITGVEFNQGMLDRARQKTAELSNVELQQGDATQLELPDGFCDAIIINQVSITGH